MRDVIYGRPLTIYCRLIGVNGLAFAVVDDNVTVEQAMTSKGQTVLPGNDVQISLAIHVSIGTQSYQTYIIFL